MSPTEAGQADDAEDPYSFDRACLIELSFPRIDAYALPLDEFTARHAAAIEAEQRRSGEDTSMNRHMAGLHKMMSRWSKRGRGARSGTHGKT